ncbi:MAG: InlB B-repeat-containing protein, partial [Bacteroidales bacterium]
TAVSSSLRSTLSSRPTKADSIFSLQMSPLWSWWGVGAKKVHGARPNDYYGFSLLPSGGILGNSKFSQVGLAAELASSSNERLHLHYANQNTYASVATASSVRCVHNPELDGTVDKNKYMITLRTNRPDETTVDPSGEKYGSLPITVKTAITNDVVRFEGWFEGETMVHSAPNYPFVVIGPRTLEARYTSITHKITITANRTNQVTITPSGDVLQGKQTTITTSATHDMLVFDGWYEGNTKVHPDKDYTFTVTGPRTLEARYNIDGTEGHCIPDVNFRNYITSMLKINIVQESYSDAGNTYFRPDPATKTAMKNATQINMYYANSSTADFQVSNMEGIQYFTGLTNLLINGQDSFIQNFTSIDLSKHTNLKQIELGFGSLTSVPKLPKAGNVKTLHLYANAIPANTSDACHDLRGVMNPSNASSNNVYVGRQGSRSTSNATAFYFRMNSNEITQNRWTDLGGSAIDSDVASINWNAGARLWNK